MTARVVYQPCSDPVARKNLQTTILNPVNLEDIEKFLSPDFVDVLRAESPSGELYVWGLAPSNTKHAWNAMSPGDVVIFNCKGLITVTSRFTHRLHSRELALQLWGWKDASSGITWEHVYLVSDVCHVSIPYPDILAIIESQPRMSFNRFSAADSNAILSRYGELLCKAVGDPVSLEDAQVEITEQMETEGSAITPTRKEHRFIVNHLFKGLPAGQCCICLREFPRHLLVAAHIKKRAACDKKEKLDIKNIAAAMCRMGCDTLFEYGYLSVGHGKVIKHPSLPIPPGIAEYLDDVEGNSVPAWSRESAKYFQWHRNTHGFEPELSTVKDADASEPLQTLLFEPATPPVLIQTG